MTKLQIVKTINKLSTFPLESPGESVGSETGKTKQGHTTQQPCRTGFTSLPLHTMQPLQILNRVLETVCMLISGASVEIIQSNALTPNKKFYKVMTVCVFVTS